MKTARALAVVVMAGCWSNPPPQYTGVQNTAPANAPKTVPLPAHSTWTGRYECGQGVTALQLTIDLEPGDAARAIFDFGPLADNPTVPNGSYRMRGTVVASSGDTMSVSLHPDEWIDQPENYVMVGLEGTIDPARHSLRGRILNDACAWLDVKRSD